MNSGFSKSRFSGVQSCSNILVINISLPYSVSWICLQNSQITILFKLTEMTVIDTTKAKYI